MRLNNDILQRSASMCCVFASFGCAGPMGGWMVRNERGAGFSGRVFGMRHELVLGAIRSCRVS